MTRPRRHIHPFGPDATGFLVYTAAGHMSVNLMEPDRPALAADVVAVAILKQALRDDPEASMDSEQTAIAARHFQAPAGYMNYSGTFEINGDVVTHHLEQSLYPEWVGTDLDRTFTLDGDTLRLSGNAGGLVQHLVWQRLG